MPKADQVVQLSRFRRRAGEYLDRCQQRGRRFVISRRGHEEAVLVSQTEWRSLLETLEVLSDSNLMNQIRRSKSAVRKGRFRSVAKVFGELLEHTE